MTAVLIAVRFAHFASVMLLFGASAFLAALAPPALRKALEPSIGRIIAAAARLAAVTMRPTDISSALRKAGGASAARKALAPKRSMTEAKCAKRTAMRTAVKETVQSATAYSYARSSRP